MAEVKLKIIADDNSMTTSFNKALSGFNNVAKISKQSLSEQKKGFTEVAKASEKANKEIGSLKPTVSIDKTTESIKILRQQIKDYINEAIKAGEATPIGQAFLKKAGEAKDRLNDLQQQVKVFGSDTKAFDGLVQGATTATAAFSVFQGASALLGNENKDVQKGIQKLAATTAVLTGLQQISNALQKESAVRTLLVSAAQKIVTITTSAYGIATTALSSRLAFAAFATKALQVATRALLGPIGLVIAAVGAIATAYALLSGSEEENTEKLIENTKATQANANAKRALLNEIEKLNDQIKVQLGLQSQQQSDLNEIVRKGGDDLIKNQQDIENEFLELKKKFNDGELKDAKEFQDKSNALFKKAKETEFFILQRIEREKLLVLANATKEQDAKNKAAIEANKERDKKALEDFKKLKEEEKKLEEQFQADLQTLLKKSIDARIELNSVEGIELRKQQQLKELDEFRKGLEEKNRLINKAFTFTREQEEQFEIIRLSIITKASNERLKLQEDEIRKTLELDKIRTEGRKKQLDIEEQILIEGIKGTVNVDEAPEVIFEKQKQLKILEIQFEFTKKRLLALGDANDPETQLLRAKFATQLADISTQIEDVTKELSKKPPFSLAKLLGFTDEEFEKIKNVANEIVGVANRIFQEQINAQQALIDKKKELNQEEIDANEDKLDDLRGQLDQELKLNAQGFASNVSAVRAQIAEVERARQEAFVRQQALQAQQEKLDKIKRTQETINQAGSLLTASANIFKALSPLGPIGVTIAGIAIAAMLASFVAAKAKFASATKLKLGGRLKGPTHDEGGMPLYEAEGDEWVVRKESAKKHDRLLDAINRDDFKKLKPIDIAPLLKDTGVVMREDVPNRITRKNDLVRSQTVRHLSASAGVEKRLENIEKKMTGFFGFYKAKPTEKDTGNTKTTKQGNITRIVRKK